MVQRHAGSVTRSDFLEIAREEIHADLGLFSAGFKQVEELVVFAEQFLER
jgi:hypothetical protein